MNATKNIGIDINWMEALEEAMDGEPIGTHAKRRQDMEEWKTGQDTVEWESMSSWGKLKIEIQGLKFGQVQKNGRLTMAVPILLGGRENRVIPFCMEAIPASGVRILRTQGDEVVDVTENEKHLLPTWRINVNWEEGRGHSIPQTRAKNEDNFDLIFLDMEGYFRQLEISVSTRAEKFWFAVQEMYAGQVVRTTKAKAEKLGVTTVEVDGHTCFVAPLYPENAYPGADWLKTSKEMGRKVVEYAIRRGTSVTLSKCSVAEWTPIPVILPEAMKANGWKTATTEWFNAIIGWGFALCSDGKVCFCHFKQILDATGRPVVSKGEFPLLTPMRGVALKWRDELDGKRKAMAIRVL